MMLGGSSSSRSSSTAFGHSTGTKGYTYLTAHLRLASRQPSLNRRLHLALVATVAAAWFHNVRASYLKSNNPKQTSTSGIPTIVAFDKQNRLDIFARLYSNSSFNRVSTRQTSIRRSHMRTFATVASSNESERQSKERATDGEPSNTFFDQKRSKSSQEAAELSDTDDITTLMRHPALLDHIKAPRNPIVLCHGLYGFDVRGPFWGLEIHYWATVLDILRKRVGAEVIVRGVPGTGAIADRAKALHEYLCSDEAGLRGKPLNFVGHSMGGLDARYLISVIKPTPEQYSPVSLVTLSTPHRGSPFMDWCNANVGTGNDRVDKEIQEAKQHRKFFNSESSADAPNLASSSFGDEQNKEDFARHQIEKPPFSLKTPLFVRPIAKMASKVEEQVSKEPDSGLTDALKPALSGVAATIVQAATSPSSALATSDKGEESEKAEITKKGHEDGSNKFWNKKEKKEKKSDSSSLIDFSLFNRALSSIGGSFSSYMLSVLDQPAYAMLSTRYMAQVFNPTVPDSPNVAYFSVASRKRSLPIYHPLWLPKLILDAAAESRTAGGERDGSADALGSKSQGNDGLVSVESAKWGKFLGIIDGCDHWDLRGGGAPRWKGKTNPKTGKPLMVEEPNEKQKVETTNSSKKNGENGWMDINRTIRNLFSSKNKEGEGLKKEEKEEKQESQEKIIAEAEKKQDQQKDDTNSLKDVIASIVPSTISTKVGEQQGLIDEVATWISDRLPEGNKERREKAERAADEQDKELRESISNTQVNEVEEKKQDGKENEFQQLHLSQSNPSDTVDQQQQQQQKDSTAEFNSMKLSIKLRREAAWQEELGHSEKARELRRELAWHRAEWDRALASGKAPSTIAERLQNSSSIYPASRELNWDAHAKNRAMFNVNNSSDNSSTSTINSTRHQQKISPSSADELERFWIAICRHLWAHGF